MFLQFVALLVLRKTVNLNRKAWKLNTKLTLMIGNETANKRVDWSIPKSHTNDAIVICGLEVKQEDCKIKEYVIKPKRRKSSIEQESKTKFKHGDLVKYTNRKKETIIGRITAMLKSNGFCKIVDVESKSYEPISPNSLKIEWRFNKIYYIEGGEVVA